MRLCLSLNCESAMTLTDIYDLNPSRSVHKIWGEKAIYYVENNPLLLASAPM